MDDWVRDGTATYMNVYLEENQMGEGEFFWREVYVIY
jgi:hypothetical protein